MTKGSTLVLDFAMRNFKDESFILQYLSPNVIRKMKLFSILDNENHPNLEITAIHDERGYQRIREKLADQYNLGSKEPNLQIYSVDLLGDRSLTLSYDPYNSCPLNKNTDEVLKHLSRLWGFTVRIEIMANNKHEIIYECLVE